MPSPEKPVVLTRRRFVASGALGGVALAVGCGLRNTGGWEFLSDEQARTLAAICDQIIPADEFPKRIASRSAQLHRSPTDPALSAATRSVYERGLELADSLSRGRFGKGLDAISSAQQFEIVNELSQRDRRFFELVRSHTFEGYYGSPRHGGNRDAVSWRMLGLAEPPVRGRAQYDLTKEPCLMNRVNAVVVGAGAAGGIVAKELSTAGLSVVLVERGKWYTPNDCRKDDLRNQRTTLLGNAFGPEDDGNPRVLLDAKGVTAHCAAQRRGLPEQRCLRGRRNAELWSAGVALYAAGFSHAFNLRGAGGKFAGRLADFV